MEKEVSTSKETKSALMYPMITFIVTIVVIGVLVTFVLPSFGSLYGSLGVEMPLPAKMLITVAEKIKSYWTYLFLALFVIVGATLIYLKTPSGQYKRDKLLLRLLLIGRVTHLSELARYCRSMSMLFRAGLPLTEVLPIIARGSRNRAMAQALNEVQQDMVRGEGLSQPMAKNSLFLPMMVQMVRVGEETGNLETTLLAVARSYEVEVEDKTRRLIAMIPPAMTLIIGLLIGLIALSLTSAMYSMYGQGF
jgi:type IV pilus assembly protein PilC